DLDGASIHDTRERPPGTPSYLFSDGVAAAYKPLTVPGDGNKLLGAVAVGGVEAYGTLQQICVNHMDLPDAPEQLILPAVEGGGVTMGVDALPDTAQICSCYDVTKGAICCSVQNGVTTLSGLKDATKASTGCGGCAALVKQ